MEYSNSGKLQHNYPVKCHNEGADHIFITIMLLHLNHEFKKEAFNLRIKKM